MKTRNVECVRDACRSNGGWLSVVGCRSLPSGELDLGCEAFYRRAVDIPRLLEHWIGPNGCENYPTTLVGRPYSSRERLRGVFSVRISSDEADTDDAIIEPESNSWYFVERPPVLHC